VSGRIRLGAVELRVQVFLERDAFLQTAGDLEHMNAPTDPEVGFRLRHVEQIGEGARLDWQRELIHDFDRVAAHGRGEHAADQRLDPGDKRRVLRALEERVDDLPVLGVFGWIRFDRQLPH
jgi:hypothetical protein